MVLPCVIPTERFEVTICCHQGICERQVGEGEIEAIMNIMVLLGTQLIGELDRLGVDRDDFERICEERRHCVSRVECVDPSLS